MKSQNKCNPNPDPCKNAGTCPLALSFTFAELLAEGRTNPELAALSSFLSSLAANLGVIIQNRNLCNIKLAEAEAETQAENQAQLQQPEDLFALFDNPSALFPPTTRRD